jgi:hypothetical protein
MQNSETSPQNNLNINIGSLHNQSNDNIPKILINNEEQLNVYMINHNLLSQKDVSQKIIKKDIGSHRK